MRPNVCMTSDDRAKSMDKKTYSQVVQNIKALMKVSSANYLYIIPYRRKGIEVVEFYGVVNASYNITENSTFSVEKLGNTISVVHSTDKGMVKDVIHPATYNFSLRYGDANIPGWSFKHNLPEGEIFTFDTVRDDEAYISEGLIVDMRQLISKAVPCGLTG